MTTALKYTTTALKWVAVTLLEITLYTILKLLSTLTGTTKIALDTTNNGVIKVNGFKTTRMD